MRVTSGAKNFHAMHPISIVRMADDILRSHWLKKAGPARARFELGFGSEKRQVATNAVINPGFMLIVKGAAESGFRPFGARDLILVLGQLLAPFGVRLDDFGRGG